MWLRSVLGILGIVSSAALRLHHTTMEAVFTQVKTEAELVAAIEAATGEQKDKCDIMS